MAPPDPAPSRRADAWRRWKALAKRAAEFQSNVLLFVLYYLMFVPIAFIQRIGGERLGRQRGWQARAEPPPSLETARRQF